MTVAEESAGESGREAWEGMPRRVAAGSGDLGVRRKDREACEGRAVPDAGALARPPFALAPVTVVTGHYGVGKTNLSLNLAYDAAARGAQVTLVDLDVVNPYFRSSDHADTLAAQGVRLIAPVFAGKGSNLDVPSLTGAIAPAIEEAYAAARQAACGGEAGPAADARTPGGFAGGPTADAVGPTSDEAAGVPPAVVIVDAGGDDAGATALGRFAADVVAGPYALLYVVNRFRNLTQTPVSAAAALPPILEAAHLQAGRGQQLARDGRDRLGRRAGRARVRRRGGAPSGPAAGVHDGAGSARPAGKWGRSLLYGWAARLFCATIRTGPLGNVSAGTYPVEGGTRPAGAGAADARATPRQAAPCGETRKVRHG